MPSVRPKLVEEGSAIENGPAAAAPPPPPPPQSSLHASLSRGMNASNGSDNMDTIGRSRGTRRGGSHSPTNSSLSRAASKGNSPPPPKRAPIQTTYMVGGGGDGDLAKGVKATRRNETLNEKPKAAGPLKRQGTNKKTRDESKELFQKMDADQSKRISLEEIAEFLHDTTNKDFWTKIQGLSKDLDEPTEEIAKRTARVAMELATGLKGQAAWDAEVTQDQFHQFRKKHLIDPVGHEEIYQRVVFAYFDDDGSGELDEEELDQFLETIHKGSSSAQKGRLSMLSVKEMKELILENYDADGNKTLSFNEVRGIISGGAAALAALKEMKEDEEQDSDEDDDVEDAADPRLAAARLLSMLKTPEEREQQMKEMEQLATLSESEEEDDTTELGDTSRMSQVEWSNPSRHGDETMLGDRDETELGDQTEKEVGHDVVAVVGDKEETLVEEPEKEEAVGANRETEKENNHVAVLDEKPDTSTPQGETKEEASTTGQVLREFDMDRAASAQSKSVSVDKPQKEVPEAVRADEKVSEEASQEFDFCDWLERTLTPGSSKGEDKLVKKGLCRRKDCIIS